MSEWTIFDSLLFLISVPLGIATLAIFRLYLAYEKETKP